MEKTMADEFIKKQDAVMTAMDYCGNGNAQNASQDIASALIELPAADVRPVVRGRWVIMSGTVSRRQCTACGWDVPEYGKFYSFCPNCGVDMREVQNGLQSG